MQDNVRTRKSGEAEWGGEEMGRALFVWARTYQVAKQAFYKQSLALFSLHKYSLSSGFLCLNLFTKFHITE